MSSGGFGDRLAAAVTARESQIVLGLDPDPGRLWPLAGGDAAEARERLASALASARAAAASLGGTGEHRTVGGAAVPGDEPAFAGESPAGEREPAFAGESPAGEHPAPGDRAAAAVLAHCLALVDAAAPACVAVKPQLACFERLGAGGWLVLEAVAQHARARGLLVLADGKRGDVPVSATPYAQALLSGSPSPFGTVPGLRADALTVNPLLGRDALEPLLAAARDRGGGLFVLVRTSNPGARDVMDAPLAGGAPLWERLARMVDALGAAGTGSAGLADVGAVTGATAPEHLLRMRELMPRTPFLLPGVGAQGGTVATLAPAFAPGRAAALVTASRSIAHAHEERGASPAAAARAEAERLRQAAWQLR